MAILGIEHVQVMIPPGGEDDARAFYGDVLGLKEVPKPSTVADRGGVWFAAGAQQIHCGVEEPAGAGESRRHPALLCDDLEGLRSRFAAAGIAVEIDRELPGYRRFYARDPFGNRVEFLERVEGVH